MYNQTNIMADTHTHYRACNLCEAICGLEIQVQEETVLSIKGDQEDPLSRGHICPKAVALKDIYEDPDRLRGPVKRTPDGWQSISWEQAFTEVVEGLQRVRHRHGADAVGVFLGNPNVHNWGSILFGPDFIKSLNTKNRFSATSTDQLPHHLVALLMYGHYLSIPVPDVDRTHFMLILGANPLASNGSLMTAPGMDKRLRGVQARGGKVVVVDPRRTETAAVANEHFFIRPGEDALFLLAMLHTLFDENLVKPGHLSEIADGVGQVATLANAYAPERVEEILGIPASEIRRLTREFAQAPSAVCYGRMGLSTQAFGSICQWLVQLVNFLTGNLDREGGAMLTTPAFDLVGQQAMRGKFGAFGRWKSRVRGLPEFGGELPVAAMAEEILEQGEGQIKSMVTIAGNPVLSIPNGRMLDEALAQLEYMVSIDIYVNETTRHAHIILPPTTGLETSHYDTIFHVLAVRNTAKYSPPLFERTDEQRHDWEIYQELAARMSGKAPRPIPPELVLEKTLAMGPYASQGLDLAALQACPRGIDLGALQPCLPDRLFTPNKRIALVPDLLSNDLARLEEYFAAQSSRGSSLLLIGRRQLRSNNSWMHNSYRLVKGRDRCTLMIHPTDATARNIQDGNLVSVRSRTGTITLKAEVTDTIMPGVVSIPHGWGHDRAGVRLSVASRSAGASINDLTDQLFIDAVSGNAAFSGVPVEVVQS
jgi:anaerobic selenocysteine-containing dehydrogenase